MTLVAVHNSTAQPQVVNDAGRTLAAGEFAAVEADARTTRLLDAGDLTAVQGDPDSPGIDESAATALRDVVTAATTYQQGAADKAVKSTKAAPKQLTPATADEES